MKKSVVYSVLILILFLLIQIGRSLFGNGIETQLVTSGSIEDVVTVEGYIVKGEDVYTASADGYVQPVIDEGVRVGVGQKLVSVYTDTADSSLKDQLDLINAKISTVEHSSLQKEIFENDKVKLESMSADEILALPETVYNGRYENVPVKKASINAVISRIRKVTGQDGAQADTLESLRAKKAELESRLSSSKTDLYCKKAGVFSLVVDGLENVLTPDNILLMTPSKYKELEDTKATPSGVCKVVDNTNYYVLVCVEAKSIMPISVGNSVSIRFPDLSSEEMAGTITYISTEEDKNVIVAVEVNRYVPDIYSTRKTNIDIVKSTYNGLSIPVSAIRTHEGKTGIFVLNNGIMRFREINILHNSSDFAIIEKENSLDGNYVKLYDEVVTDARKYEDGMIVT